MEKVIHDSIWKTSGTGTIGIVLVLYYPEGSQFSGDFIKWRAFMGYIEFPTSEKEDSIKISEWGAPLSLEEALGFFPKMNPFKSIFKK